MRHRKVIAVDFDGTLCKYAWPRIGEPNWPVIERVKAERENGAAIILWTCRAGQYLEDAVTACGVWGIQLDAVNENIPELVSAYGHSPRKIGADEYWDDRAVRVAFGEGM